MNRAIEQLNSSADALVEHNHHVKRALYAWELAQLAYGVHLLQYGQALGDRSQFTYGTDRFGENVTALQSTMPRVMGGSMTN